VQRAIAGFGALVLAGLAGAGEAQAQGKCQSLKFKAAGIVAKAKAICHSRAAKAGTDVDPDCLASADAKLARRWAAAELQGGCVTTGDQAAAVSATNQCLGAIVDVVDPPPPPTSLCCNLPNDSCAHGEFLDAEACGSFGGTVGPAGSACDGGTGTCVMTAPTIGRCCMATAVSFCNAGPNLDLSGCVPPQFLDAPFAICSPTGACALP
jgi:hypothetical protein